MRTSNLSMLWAALAGIILVAVGLLAFVDNPIVGKAANAIIPANEIHNVVHILTGILALYVAFSLKGVQQANAVVGFGVLYAVIFVVNVISPSLFGLFGDYPSILADHVIHLGLAVVSLAVGWMGRTSAAMA